jgi:hypothetical protein
MQTKKWLQRQNRIIGTRNYSGSCKFSKSLTSVRPCPKTFWTTRLFGLESSFSRMIYKCIRT